MPELTAKQQETLAFVVKFQRSKRRAPTYAEIAEHFGLKSINAAFLRVRQLEEKGCVLRSAGKARSIRVAKGRSKGRSDRLDLFAACRKLPESKVNIAIAVIQRLAESRFPDERRIEDPLPALPVRRPVEGDRLAGHGRREGRP